MTTTTTDYSQSCVYGFMKEEKMYYVGSTYDLSNRYSGHKSHCNNENSHKYNYRIYKFMRENGGFDSFEIVKIRDCPECKTKKELKIYERKYYDHYNPELNHYKPQLTEDELINFKEQKNETQRNDYAQNPEKYNIRNKKYREENAESVKAYRDKYREENAEKLKLSRAENTENNRIYKEKYYEENAEKLKLCNEKYRRENDAKIKEKFNCECGGRYSLQAKSVHKKTLKHLKYMEEQNQHNNIVV
jgi:hypothetical protein